MKLFVDKPRFEGVPFYLRAGKGLAENRVDISVVFKQTCHLLFKEYGCPEGGNVLTIKIQPNEGIGIRVVVKTPGQKVALKTAEMKFSYAEEFGHRGTDAYEKLLMDILAGDQMLFNRSDELESSWQLISNILGGFAESGSAIPEYEVGSWGPKEANDLIEKDSRKWI